MKEKIVAIRGNKKIPLIVTLLISTLVIMFIFNYFRYIITGTNKGYIIKTDRITGKSYAISPAGESEIGVIKTPEEIIKEFNQLKTLQEKSALWDHYVTVGVITKGTAERLKVLQSEQ